MATSKDRELEQKFWKALKSDRTVMVGVDGIEDGHSRPLTGHRPEAGRAGQGG